MLHILIADDHEIFRRGIRGLLQAHHGWKVAAEAVNGREAVEKTSTLKPDIAIIDISMPELDGLQATRQIRVAVPKTKIIILTMHDSDQMVRRVFEAGASGYVLKSDYADCLAQAVTDVSQGKRFLTPKVSEIVFEGFLKTNSQHQQRERAAARTTPRELEIIRLLAEGKANKEVAALLGITVRTVETHRAKILLKIGCHSLVELIHHAINNDIILTKELG